MDRDLEAYQRGWKACMESRGNSNDKNPYSGYHYNIKKISWNAGWNACFKEKFADDFISRKAGERDEAIRSKKKTGRKNSWKSWTPEEDEIIRKNYPGVGQRVSAFLENRTEKMVCRRANLLGVKSQCKREKQHLLKKEDKNAI